VSPRQLYELASPPEWSAPEHLPPLHLPAEPRRSARRGWDHEHLVPTFQMRRRTEVRVVLGKLVFPIALLLAVGIMIGAYGALGGPPGAAPVVAPAAPGVLPAEVAAPVVAPAPATGSSAAVAVAPAAAAAPELVEIRIESSPAGASVMLVDRGRTQLIGTTPVDTAVDPSRAYDLVFAHASGPPQVEHLDPTTTRRVAVVLGKHEAAPRPADSPPRPADSQVRRVERATAERTAEPQGRPSRARTEPVGQGTLMISSKPPCEIVIDGKPTGLTTPQRSIPVAAGSHRITLINSDNDTRRTVTVQIAPNATEKVIEDLMK
jgi:hypothetical protein